MTHPSARELLATARVVSLPLVTRFRGVEHREAVLFEGPEGWTEFSPFLEYEDAEAAVWLAAAIDFGWRRQPEPVRDRVPVNATVNDPFWSSPSYSSVSTPLIVILDSVSTPP